MLEAAVGAVVGEPLGSAVGDSVDTFREASTEGETKQADAHGRKKCTAESGGMRNAVSVAASSLILPPLCAVFSRILPSFYVQFKFQKTTVNLFHRIYCRFLHFIVSDRRKA